MSGQRVAVIIGGASGIGWASAGKLAAEGCRVVIADRNVDGARERAAELGAPHTWAQVEVTDEDSVARLFDDELESIRTFDPATQRSLAVRDQVALALGLGGAGLEGLGLAAVVIGQHPFLLAQAAAQMLVRLVQRIRDT